MSCYIRHLSDFMEALGLENTTDNRKSLDLAIRKSIGMNQDDHCPEVWAKLKPVLADESKKAKLLNSLQEEYNKGINI